MSSDFNDLINKGKSKQEKPKTDVFKTLKRTIASSKPPGISQNEVEEVAPAIATTSSTSTLSKTKEEKSGFKLNLKSPKDLNTSLPVAIPETDDAVSAVSANATDTSPSDTASSFSEKDYAAEFNSPDQPEGFDKEQVIEIKKKLKLLEDHIDNKDIVQNALKVILIRLKEHEFLKNILKPEDLGLMVRGLRESYGTTITVKTQRSGKRKQVQHDVDAVMDELSDLGEIQL